MLQLWYHRREEQTIQVFTVNKSIDSFLFQREESAKSVEEPSFTWSICRKVQRLFRPNQGFSDSINPAVSPRAEGGTVLNMQPHAVLIITLSVSHCVRHTAQQQEVPKSLCTGCPSSYLQQVSIDVSSTSNPNTSIFQVLYYPNKALENF